MQFRILGSPELYDEKRHRRIPLTSPKQRLLLGTLLARPNSPVPRERLIRELWGALPPRKARNTLNAHVSGLRKVLLEVEPERAHTPRIVARAAGYLLEVRPAETDSGRFCLAVAQAQRVAQDDPRGAYDSLRRALGLWRGSALEGAPTVLSARRWSPSWRRNGSRLWKSSSTARCAPGSTVASSRSWRN